MSVGLFPAIILEVRFNITKPQAQDIKLIKWLMDCLF